MSYNRSAWSYVATDGQVGECLLVSGKHLGPITRYFISTYGMAIAGFFLCGTPSLTRGSVCNLLPQLLLGLVSAVILGSKSCKTRCPYVTVSFETPSTWTVTVTVTLRLTVSQSVQPGLQGPCIYIPQILEGPRALGSLFVSS
jgi:hypothetical protein